MGNSDEHMVPVKMAELPEVTSGTSCGRPKVEVDLVEVNQLTAIMEFNKTKVAQIVGISRKTLYNKKVGQSGVMPKYTNTDGMQLDSSISTIILTRRIIQMMGKL